MLNIKKISSIDENFSENLKKHISQRKVSSSDIKEKVKNIIYDVKENPLKWLDTMLNGVEHMNFFEGRATEYSKASTKGTWGEVFA